MTDHTSQGVGGEGGAWGVRIALYARTHSEQTNTPYTPLHPLHPLTGDAYLTALDEQRAERAALHPRAPELPQGDRFKLTERERSVGTQRVAELRRMIDCAQARRDWGPR